MSRASANLLLCLTAAIWGLGFIAQSTAMQAIGPWTYNATRFGLAAAVLVPFALAERRRAGPMPPRKLAGFALVGLILFAAAGLQQFGISQTSVTNAGFLTGLYVVLTPLIALVLTRSVPHPVVWPAAVVAFCGIAAIAGGALDGLNAGDGLVIAGAVFWALHIVAIERFGRADRGPFTLSLVQFAIVALLSAPGAVVEAPSGAALAAALPEILYGGLVATALAITLQVVAQAHTPASQVAIFLSGEALFAALFSFILLGERLSAGAWLGCAMVFLAMLAVELVPMRPWAARPSSSSGKQADEWMHKRKRRAES
ncbi:DMT family transporter [Aureimonas populi]|uniref:DMT family transporter n=1 Tax=Aureimonas populi TaxID=1701758 RepID=A0ABW5CJ68_9HYPH|nr:DMT family transporter [Aureimonas populi]